MSRRFSTRIRRFILSFVVLGSVVASVIVGPAYGSSAARLHDSVPVGTDLWHLDTATGHYTQAANGLTDLQLYNSPVGIPDANGWHLWAAPPRMARLPQRNCRSVCILLQQVTDRR